MKHHITNVSAFAALQFWGSVCDDDYEELNAPADKLEARWSLQQIVLRPVSQVAAKLGCSEFHSVSGDKR